MMAWPEKRLRGCSLQQPNYDAKFTVVVIRKCPYWIIDVLQFIDPYYTGLKAYMSLM
jgi:hypothetical protein